MNDEEHYLPLRLTVHYFLSVALEQMIKSDHVGCRVELWNKQSEVKEEVAWGQLRNSNTMAHLLLQCNWRCVRICNGNVSINIKRGAYLQVVQARGSFMGKGWKEVAITGMICLGVMVCNHSVLAAELCKQTQPIPAENENEVVTNEGIVEEAWRVVNENFFDARHHKWSSHSWLKKQEDALNRPIPSKPAAYDIIRHILASLDDPYTRFLTPSEFSKLARYDLTGIGINLKEVFDEDGSSKLKVQGIVLGGPAYSVGIKQGDEILSVNGVSVKGKTTYEASSMIQGPKGTFVTIEVKHSDCDKTRSVKIERQQAIRTPVFYRLEQVQNGNELMGYVRLKEFNALSKKDLVIALQRLRDAGASSFVLDLRDNPGGLVQAGIEVAKLFLEGGKTVTYTIGRDPQSQKGFLAQNPPLTTAPLMVLVNEHTASASEIVAAALHDNCRAVLVGSRTFGKGLIQSVYELKDGSGVVVTVGKYVTPRHNDIDGNGIEPDFHNRPGLAEAKQNLSHCQIPAE